MFKLTQLKETKEYILYDISLGFACYIATFITKKEALDYISSVTYSY